MIRFTFPTLLAAGLACAAIAQDAPTLSLAGEEFNETVREGAEISGAVVAGVQVRRPDPAAIDFMAFVPADWMGGDVELCSRVLSRNGLYESANTYRIEPAGREGAGEVSFPTENDAVLLGAGREELAIRVTRGACDAPPGELDVTVAFWNADGLEDLRILVNSLRSDRVFAYVGDSAAPIPCETVEGEDRTAFDTSCPIAGLPEEGPARIEIYRVKNGTGASETITLHYPRS